MGELSLGEIARDVLECARAWEPGVRLLGNVQASDVARLAEAVDDLAAKNAALRGRITALVAGPIQRCACSFPRGGGDPEAECTYHANVTRERDALLALVEQSWTYVDAVEATSEGSDEARAAYDELRPSLEQWRATHRTNGDANG